MATWQIHSPYAHQKPTMLDGAHRGQLFAFLSEDVPLNLFQLCWLENHGVERPSRPDLFHYSGLFTPTGRLAAVALVITNRLGLVYARAPEAAEALGRWYRRQGLVFEHVVSGRESVTPFWRAYTQIDISPAVRARLDRDQKLYVLDRDRWYAEVRPRLREDFAPTEVRLGRVEELEAIYLASARMHLEETLENPLETQPETFRRHVRHRIQAQRSFVWFDEHRRLSFKADLSARSSFGAQISGVYTPPRLRGQGVATRGLFDICDELFESGLPRVTLYVNAENAPAHRVYQKVGFEYHADYQTIFVESR